MLLADYHGPKICAAGEGGSFLNSIYAHLLISMAIWNTNWVICTREENTPIMLISDVLRRNQ